MHLKYEKMLAIVVHENMKLGDNTLNNEWLSLVNTKLWQNISELLPLFYCLTIYKKNLKTKRSYKRKINLKNFIFFKNLSSGLKIIR